MCLAFLKDKLYQNNAGDDGCYCSDQSRHHKGVVEYVFPDVGGSGAVEIDGSNDGGIVGDEKVTVDCRKHGDQQVGGDTEGYPQGHESADRCSLAIE